MPSFRRFYGMERASLEQKHNNHFACCDGFHGRGSTGPSIPVGSSQLPTRLCILEANTACFEKTKCKELGLGAKRSGSR